MEKNGICSKRKIEQIDTDEVAPVASTKVKQHDLLVEAAAVFTKARVKKLSLADRCQNHRDVPHATDVPDVTGVPDDTELLLPSVSSLDDAYRIQVGNP